MNADSQRKSICRRHSPGNDDIRAPLTLHPVIWSEHFFPHTVQCYACSCKNRKQGGL